MVNVKLKIDLTSGIKHKDYFSPIRSNVVADVSTRKALKNSYKIPRIKRINIKSPVLKGLIAYLILF